MYTLDCGNINTNLILISNVLLLAWSFFLLVAEDKPDDSQLSRSSDGSAGGGGSDTSRTDSKDIQEEVISMQVIEILFFYNFYSGCQTISYFGGWKVCSLHNKDFLRNNVLQPLGLCIKFYKCLADVIAY